MNPIHPHLGRNGRRAAMLVYFACIAAGLVGCKSGTTQIARAASNTDTLTARIDDHSRALRPIVAESDEGKLHLDGIDQATRDIRKETQKVHEALPTVKDVTPWWATLIGNGFLLTGLVFVVGLAFYFGLAPLIAKAVAFLASWATWIIPKGKRDSAKLDFEALEANPKSPEVRETIAARRARDVQYDAAYKAVKREKAKAVKP